MLQKYPKSKTLFYEFLKRNLTKLSDGQAKFEELSDQEFETIAEMVLKGNQRILYDFLDEQEIAINVFGVKNDWGYNDCETTFSSRQLAEQAGFEECLKQLENEKK